MRILCLDIGTKRIGIAASDPLGWTAQPVKVLIRRGDEKIFEEIAELCRELEVDRIVVGLPLDEEGGVGAQAAKVKNFAAKIEESLRQKGIDVPFEFQDERYSTSVAKERLIGADVSRKRRKQVIDKMAAVVILETYLNEHEIAAGESEGAEG